MTNNSLNNWPLAVIQALQEAELVQKHDRLSDLAAIDAIPIELLPLLTLNNQISIANRSSLTVRKFIESVYCCAASSTFISTERQVIIFQ